VNKQLSSEAYAPDDLRKGASRYGLDENSMFLPLRKKLSREG
jgi:hypothetical protein